MADDNILEIGATINLASFLPGVDKMSASTRAATQVMAQSFQQLATTTLASTAQMTTAFTSVAPAAQVIPPAVRRVEASVHESTTAMVGDWRRLAVGVKESAVGIVESLTEVGAKMSETAERSRLGIGTMEAGFAGLAGILGAGIAVGFAADFLDETSRVLIELEHLNTTTGISVETLSGLRNVAQQAAVPFEALQVALVRMQRAQVEALEGQTTYTRAFHDLGISLAELKTLSPEQLFFKLATAMGSAQQSQVAVSSGIEIMGRGVYTLLPLLQKYGGNLRQVTDEAAKQSGVTKEAVETAMKWHRETAQLSQMFQAFMVPVLEVVVNLLPRVAYAMGLVGVQFAIGYNLVRTFTLGIIELGKVFSTIANDIYGSGSIFDIPKHMQQAMNDLGRIAYDGLHRVTQNFSDARDMWDHLISRKPPKTIFEQAKDDMDELFKKPQGELEVSQPTVKSDQMAKFREQLDQMRDAQTGFHELSKADEAAFWKDKLALAKNNVKLYREVYHEYVTAERAARKESLSGDVSDTEEAVAQTKQGSVERIVILREELDHLRAIGAEETADYKRLQNQLLEAVRARTQQEAKAEEEKQKQAKQVALIDQDIVQASEQSKLEIRRASLTTQASLGLISGRQRLEIDRQIITEEIALERQALEAKLLIYRREPVEYEKVKKDLAALNEKYNRLLAQNNDEMLKMNLSGWLRFNQQVTTGFSTAVGRWIETGRGFGTALAQQWNQMVVQFGQALARMLAQFALHELAKVVLVQTSETQQTAAATAGNAARADAGLIADLKSIGRAAAVGAAHAFKWVMEEVPFPANIALAPAAAAAAFAGIMAFGSLGGKAAKGGVLGEDGPVFAHAREMILPPPISIGLQNLVRSGGLNLPPALSQNFSSIGGTTSTSHTTTVHHNTVSPRIAVTVNGTSDGMTDLHNTVVKTIKRALRNGQLNFNEV